MTKFKLARLVTLPLLLWATLLIGCAQMSGQKASEPQVRERNIHATVTATVKAVDLAKREVVLAVSEGQPFTLVVDQRVTRLSEVKPGDLVRAEYFFAIAAEVREPTSAEAASPLEEVVGEVKAPPSSAPGGAALRQIRAVVTIVDIDRPDSMVVVQGPRGNYLEIEVADQKLLKRLRVGQKSVLTFTEALALSLEKVK